MDKPTYRNAGLSIAPVTRDELPAFAALMSEYAESLRPSSTGRRWVTTQEDLAEAMFAEPPRFEALIGRYKGEPAALACWSERYHIMTGRLTMQVNHIYVTPAHRREPLAVSLFVYLLRLAVKRGYWRVEGEVGEWNKPVQKLYGMLKAEKLDHITYRLQEPNIARWVE